jgi:hypothetical protein
MIDMQKPLLQKIRKLSVVLVIGIMLTLITAIFVSSATTPPQVTQSVSSKGQLTLINIGVYSNSACTSNLTSLDFGSIYSGSTSNITLWIKNVGNSNEIVSLSTNTWSPVSVSQWVTLSWNQTGTVLAQNQVVAANMILTVSASVNSSLSSFTFNTVIAGTAT